MSSGRSCSHRPGPAAPLVCSRCGFAITFCQIGCQLINQFLAFFYPARAYEDQCPCHPRVTSGDIEHDRTSARVAEQVNRSEIKLSSKLSEIIGMLKYRKVVVASVPW